MANPRIWNRKLHRWGAIAVAVPFLIVICTGILLQIKKQLDWVQPPERKGSSTVPAISLPDILDRVRTIPQTGIRSWDDVDRVDVRPGKGMLKVVSTSRWEVQLDVATGDVLQVAYRRSDLIESIHDGSFFHPFAKLGVFLPMGLLVLGLWMTGIYLWLLPYRARRATRHRRESEARAA